MAQLHLYSVHGDKVKSWTKRKASGPLVEITAANNESNGEDDGYTMHIHSVAALRGDLVAISEPSAHSVWIADLQKGVVLQAIDFDSPLDLTVTREGKTMFLGVDGRRHIGLITIHRHHASRRTLSENAYVQR